MSFHKHRNRPKVEPCCRKLKQVCLLPNNYATDFWRQNCSGNSDKEMKTFENFFIDIGKNEFEHCWIEKLYLPEKEKKLWILQWIFISKYIATTTWFPVVRRGEHPIPILNVSTWFYRRTQIKLLMKGPLENPLFVTDPIIWDNTQCSLWKVCENPIYSANIVCRHF